MRGRMFLEVEVIHLSRCRRHPRCASSTIWKCSGCPAEERSVRAGTRLIMGARRPRGASALASRIAYEFFN